MSRGVVLVRSPDPATQLQALRTALSLSLGDRPADLVVAASAAAVLLPAAGSEAEQCLDTLRKTGLEVELEAPGRALVERLAGADFIQAF